MLTDGDLRWTWPAGWPGCAGAELALTVREFDLLVFLLRNPGRAFRRGDLLEAVWGWTFGDQSTVTVHMRRLREKIEDDPAAPKRIVTVWGVGLPVRGGAGVKDVIWIFLVALAGTLIVARARLGACCGRCATARSPCTSVVVRRGHRAGRCWPASSRWPRACSSPSTTCGCCSSCWRWPAR